ncbi:Clan CA, family C19, ubiquitin hydrolase-like cysteine peptidase [Histomonas meleagridis]|uniref:Clan CA, family C19, ubiquitin hydrolase-like cysteine peptidase n=1 Tax=Histomonas meleagridis TaxID=135588 RepID=UPI00355A9E31|nr:Clan CA, family C19, ubiquitin hydrolase-like cysteine peptidase [Histomonas meleagridis]KAH0802866.1 Clan CA, family C19, ubiquitin hydrolase-like cysteine peptidase [Histomonas meleagridis]
MNLPTAQEQKNIIKNLLSNQKYELGEKAYVLSLLWFRQWKDSVGFTNNEPKGKCPPIDNTNILENGSIKKSLMEGFDFKVVSKEIWDKFYEWYGGGPEHSVDVEYNPTRKECVPIVSLITVKVIFHKEIIPIQTSRYRKISLFKEDVCTKKGLNPSEYGLYEYEKGKKYDRYDESKVLAQHAITSGKIVLLDCISNPSLPQSPSRSQQIPFSAPSALNVSRQTYSSFSPQIASNVEKQCVPGTSGFKNLGNTCFFNSSLQCLVHTTLLCDYFQNTDWKKDICTTSKLGAKGVFSCRFASLVNDCWSGKYSVISPHEIFRVLQANAPQFSGYSQQDSHELLLTVLSFIHEDLNRSKDKPPIKSIEGDGTNDSEVAREAWERHKKREDSIIVDLFHGQLRSSMLCPNCGKTTNAFDPYLSLQLPVPSEIIDSPEFIFVPFNPLEPRKAVKLPIVEPLMEEPFRKNLEKAIGRKLTIAYCVRQQDTFLLTRGPCFPRSSQLYVFEIPEKEDALYSIAVLGYNSKSIFRTVTKVIDAFIFEIPNEDPSNEELQKAICERFDFLWSDEKVELTKNVKSIMKSIVPFKSKEKFEITVKNPTKHKRNKPFERSRHDKRFAPNNVIALLNQKVGEDVNFNWGRLEIPIETISFRQTKKSNPTLKECVECFSQVTTLDEMNKWQCPHCKEYVCASKKTDIWSLPQILVIQFKRFRSTQYGFKKNNTVIEFPDLIDLKDFVIGPDKGSNYKLYGVVEHFGQLSGGHYIADAFLESKQKWLCFNDSNVSEVSGNKPGNQHAYILFYKKVEK